MLTSCTRAQSLLSRGTLPCWRPPGWCPLGCATCSVSSSTSSTVGTRRTSSTSGSESSKASLTTQGPVASLSRSRVIWKRPHFASSALQCQVIWYSHNGATSSGNRTTHWQIAHVPLNATKPYLVVFEVRKGNGTSEGGFSIDDINLSGTECPHFTMQLNNFQRLLNNSDIGEIINSPRLYSRGGYSYRVGILMLKMFFGLYVQLLSGNNDANLEWPLPQRQVTIQMMDQQPDLRERMSKEGSFTSDLSTFNGVCTWTHGCLLQPAKKSVLFLHFLCSISTVFTGSFLWDNPRIVGTPFQDDDGQTSYEGPMIGYQYYSDFEEIKRLSFLKGASAVFTFRFEGIDSPLQSHTIQLEITTSATSSLFSHHSFEQLSCS